MAIGPAMLMAALGGLALATMGKKPATTSSPGIAPPLPSGAPPAPKGSAADPIVNTAAGPIPVALPQSFHDLLVKALQGLTVQDDGTIKGPITPEAIQQATTIGAQLDAAGFPDAAAALRVFIQRAATQVPRPAPDKTAPLPGVSQVLVDQINRAIQLERDPAKLQAILDALLASAPPSPQRDALAQMLEQAIKQVQAAMVLADTLKKTDEVLKSPGLPPISTTPAPVIELPNTVITASPPTPSVPTTAASEIPDTVNSRRGINLSNYLRNLVVDNGSVKAAKGKEDKGMVMAFQKAEGLTQDGKMGPGGVKTLAKYTGDIPPVFYWPTSATSKNVLQFRADLLGIADQHDAAGHPLTAAKLRAAASKERGQAGIVGTMPA